MMPPQPSPALPHSTPTSSHVRAVQQDPQPRSSPPHPSEMTPRSPGPQTEFVHPHWNGIPPPPQASKPEQPSPQPEQSLLTPSAPSEPVAVNASVWQSTTYSGDREARERLKVGLFERCRDDRHEFSPSAAAAGLNRKVCARCGLVLIDLGERSLRRSGLFMPSKPSLFSLRHDVAVLEPEAAMAGAGRRRH